MINILDISKDRAQKSRINIDAIGFLQTDLFKSNFFKLLYQIGFKIALNSIIVKNTAKK